MTAAEILRTLEGALRPLVEDSNNGRLSLAHDPDHALELLATSPRGWRVVLGWEGYDPDGGDPMHGLLSASFYAVVQQARGLHDRRGFGRHRPRVSQSSALSVMERAEQVSLWLRSARWQCEDDTFHPQIDTRGAQVTGAEWLEIEGLDQTLQIRISWSILIGLDLVETFAVETET